MADGVPSSTSGLTDASGVAGRLRLAAVISHGLLPGLFVLLVFWTGLWAKVFEPLFPEINQLIYSRTPFWELVLQHLEMVAAAGLAACVIGVGLGIGVTRRSGREFLPMVNSLVSIGQTFPPVAVLALAVPAVGFGAKPTIVALFLYGILPIVRNTVAGLESVPEHLKDSARGMGMTDLQVLAHLELPLAWPILMAGVRTSIIITIGTATIGATVGAGGLGAPIIAGLNSDNPVFILQGAILAGLFAVLVDRLLERLERCFNGSA